VTRKTGRGSAKQDRVQDEKQGGGKIVVACRSINGDLGRRGLEGRGVGGLPPPVLEGATE